MSAEKGQTPMERRKGAQIEKTDAMFKQNRVLPKLLGHFGAVSTFSLLLPTSALMLWPIDSSTTVPSFEEMSIQKVTEGGWRII